MILFLQAVMGGRVMPRGLGWLVLPIVAIGAGFRIGPILGDLVAAKSSNAIRIAEIRYLLAGSAFWVAAVLLYIVMFEPFGYYMKDRDYLTVAKIISFPIILALVGMAIVGWLRRHGNVDRRGQ